MEKVESLKEKVVQGILSNTKTKCIIGTILLSEIGVTLLRIFHVLTGSTAGATIADKVIGKVAGSVLAVAGIKELYADAISKFAIPVLEKNGIKYEYNNKVDFIQNNDKTGMCPMENKFKDESDLNVIYNFFVK